MMTACCLSGMLCACAKAESTDLKMSDLKSRIDIERDAVSDLRQRQAQAQREKSLLLTEIDQEVSRISKLNREVQPSQSSTHARTSWKRPAAAQVSSMPPVVPVKQEPDNSCSASGDLAIDAESKAEIDRLVEMREKLVAERDSLEQIVKP